MSAPDDPDILSKVTAGLGAALTALATWAWAHTHKRVDAVDAKIDGKASTVEVDRHRDHIAKLFDKVQELSDKTDMRFSKMESDNFSRHVELLHAIHETHAKKN